MIAENVTSTLNLFKTRSPSLVGIDIASTSLKLVELSEAGKGTYRLERYAIEPLGKDLVQDGNIGNLDQVSDALRRAWKKLGGRNRQVALALPSAMVITKRSSYLRTARGGARTDSRGRGQSVHTLRA